MHMTYFEVQSSQSPDEKKNFPGKARRLMQCFSASVPQTTVRIILYV
jgi:hypothetical protein